MKTRVAALLGAGVVALVAGAVEDRRPPPSVPLDGTTVLHGADGGPGSLREAIFAAAEAGRTIDLRTTEILVESPLPPIVRLGTRVSSPSGTVVRREGGPRAPGSTLVVAADAVELRGLRFVGGETAIDLRRGDLHLDDVGIEGSGLGVDAGPGAGALHVSGSLFRRNTIGVRVAQTRGPGTRIEDTAFEGHGRAAVWATVTTPAPLEIVGNSFSADTAALIAAGVPTLFERNTVARSGAAGVLASGRGLHILDNTFVGGLRGLVGWQTEGLIADGNAFRELRHVGLSLRDDAGGEIRDNVFADTPWAILVTLSERLPPTLLEGNRVEGGLTGLLTIASAPRIARNDLGAPSRAAIEILDYRTPEGTILSASPDLAANELGGPESLRILYGTYEERR